MPAWMMANNVSLNARVRSGRLCTINGPPRTIQIEQISRATGIVAML